MPDVTDAALIREHLAADVATDARHAENIGHIGAASVPHRCQ
jgi:hypothetical protein